MLESKIFKTHEKYSAQENDALKSNENYVLLGRSGTGKTLVALTKIFLLKMCANMKETKDLIKGYDQSQIYLRIIFVTTSNNLIEEVTKYYILMEKKFMEAISESKSKNIESSKNLIQNNKNKFLEKKENDDYNTFDHIKVLIFF